MNLSIAIMAAGFGTRMKSTTPKVLHTISGYPMLYHIIKEAKKLSTDIHVILFHQHEQVKAVLDTYFEDLTYIIQDHANFPGTGGALMGVQPKYDHVLVLNGDMPLLEAEDMKKLLESEADISMSVFTATNPTGYGRVLLDGLHVKGIVEEKDASAEQKNVTSVNAGVYRFNKKFLETNLSKLSNNNAQKEYYLTDLITLANNTKTSVEAVFVDETTFMGVNSKVHLAQAEVLMQRRMKERLMAQGVIMRLPETIYIDAEATLEGECILENNVTILGKCHLQNAHIKTGSVIEESTIIDSDVGPLARIRPQSHLSKTHIGNFVEIKKSTLNGVKAGHLSYLGDATIDEGTNVGCGTITCNYDGKKKYQTIIGKNVFIGSDTQLIAPVTIEDNVMIAAGTTVTKDVKSGTLAISRTPLKQIEGFFHKFFGDK